MALTTPMRSPDISTTSADSTATSVPVPIARPTSAPARAGASLIRERSRVRHPVHDSLFCRELDHDTRHARAECARVYDTRTSGPSRHTKTVFGLDEQDGEPEMLGEARRLVQERSSAKCQAALS